MIDITPTNFTDFLDIEVQDEQLSQLDEIRDPIITLALLESGPCFTVRYNGVVKVIFGAQIYGWNSSCILWSVFSHDSGHCMLHICRFVQAWIRDYLYKYRRIEISVRVAFPAGHKLAKILGFELEGVRRCYTKDGDDEAMYSIINPKGRG